MKQFWVDIRPFNKEIATTAIESGADAVVVDRSEDIKTWEGSLRSRLTGISGRAGMSSNVPLQIKKVKILQRHRGKNSMLSLQQVTGR